MENENVNFSTGGGISTQYKTIDEVQNMIRHLQQLEEHMITNGAKGFSASFEDLSLIDVDDFQIDENETEWLTKIPGAKKISAKDLQSDESFIDSGLLNVRYALLNLIKSSKIEEKAASILTTSPARCTKALGSMGTYDIRRKSPPMSTISNMMAPSQRPTSPKSYHKLNFENSPSRAYTTIRSDNESSPPITASIKSPYEFLSPGFQPQLSVFERPNRDINQLFNSTPSGKIDSRTYTRPKKQRMPLDTTTLDQLELHQVSPIKYLQNNYYQQQNQQPDIMEYDPTVESETLIGSNPKINMNETFVAAEFEDDDDDDDNESEKYTRDKQPRRVTRNLSYVIRRDSESPNNNSPPVPSSRGDDLENEQLNNTFVRASRREDTYSPSPTGSSNSIHNTSSMEELHNLARQQEQSLRMTSNPRMLTRKETHTVVRVPIDSHMQQPIIRNTTTEGGQPQQKLRLQSRIPAPGMGAGSRIGSIRPPTAINGHNNITTTTTRRPMTRGGAY